MSVPFSPNIIYPNGGEIITNGEVTIQWSTPNVTPDNRPVVYEIYYTDNFDPNNEPDLQQIATVSSSLSSYNWRFGKGLRSDKCRVAIRARNARGERSNFQISAANFSVSKRKLINPSVISPVSGGRYGKMAEIIFDNSGIKDTYSQRSFYQIFYSSLKSNIPLTPIAQNVSIDSDPVIWNLVDLPPSDDYIVQLFLQDDEGNSSDSIFIKNIIVSHDGFFIVDTTPPVASITINSNAAFTKKREVSVSLKGYDEATGVHSVLIQEGDNIGTPESFANIKQFILSDSDGIKTVQTLLQDFGGNRNDDLVQRLFEVILEFDSDTTIADIAVDVLHNTLWAVTSGTESYLYKVTDFPVKLSTYSESTSAVAVFNSQAFVATVSSNNIGSLYRFDGIKSELLKTFDEGDSQINCMCQHGTNLYLGMENGLVYSFDGLNFDNIDILPNPVNFIRSDGSTLFLSIKGSLDLYIFNGNEFFSTST